MPFNFTSDLACYSLSCNSNVPTTALDLNHYYTYRQQQSQPQQLHQLHQLQQPQQPQQQHAQHQLTFPLHQAQPQHPQTHRQPQPARAANSTGSATAESADFEKLVQTEPIAAPATRGTNATTPTAAPASQHPSSINVSVNIVNNNGTGGTVRRLSMLDLLIQTATSDIAKLATDAPPHQLPTQNIPPPVTTSSPKNPFDILCKHAQKELLSSATTTPALAQNYPRKDYTTPNLIKPATANSKIAKKSTKSKKKEDASSSSSSSSLSPANHLAIKLASPSTNTKRQRSGPSCDCCRSRKIKCDSEIFILSNLDNVNMIENDNANDPNVNRDETVANSYIAHCEFISSNLVTGYQYYKIVKDEEHSLHNKLTSFNYLQFKPCKACTVKNLKCCFSKGFTRNDIIKFNKSERQNSDITMDNGSSTSQPIQQQQQQQQQQQTAPPTPPILTHTVPLKSEKTKQELMSTIVSTSSLKTLPTPSPTPNVTISPSTTAVATPTPMIVPAFDDDEKKSKKTSCKTCRFKKIKCVKINGLKICVYCTKKSLDCLFE